MNYLVFVPIVTAVLALFFGAHYGIYLFMVHFFPAAAAHKTVLAILITLFALSFFVASSLAHWIDTIFSRAFYFASGIWMGTMLNVLLAILATYAVLFLARWFGYPLSEVSVAGACFMLAMIMSMYGVWNALHPRIQNITVTIPHLPEQWKGQKIVQISDVHLGHIYHTAFLQKIVNAINKENPKIVVITGDLFDGMDGELASFVSPLDALQAPHGALFIDGNHETYLGTQKTLDILHQTKVRILRDEVVDVDGLSFIGVMYPERGEKKTVVDVVKTLAPQFQGKPNVLLYHAPSMIRELSQLGVHLQLSGHTHRGQQFPFQIITYLAHKGYDYGLYTIGDYTLYTSSGVGTWGPAMRIGTQSEIVVITLQ